LNLPAVHADDVWVVKGGVVVLSGPPGDVLRAKPLSEIYGVAFDEATVEGRPTPVVVPRW
jgi:ABC-type cobalamin transport system ATPase subunit